MKHYRLLTSVVFIIIPWLSYGQTSITSISSGIWNNPSTWSDNRVPTAEDQITIQEKHTVELIGDCEAKSIRLNGTLRPTNNLQSHAFNLDTEWILVAGNGAMLQVGTENTPYLGQAIITLNGRDDNDQFGQMGDKFIGTMAEGTTLLHGAPTQSWVRIDDTVNSGERLISLSERVNWKIGQSIILTSTQRDLEQTEVLTIKAISSDQLQIQVEEPIVYEHYAGTHSYDNGKSGNAHQSWTVNMSAEVGLLSRNIIIQGDEESSEDGYGGHIMTMPDGFIQCKNVEMRRLGQQYHIGRYPFHWHLAEDARGEYIRNSSIHHCYNRAVVIHGTDSSDVSNNVVYNIWGSAIFLEDGVEQYNTIIGNLVANVLVPPHSPEDKDYRSETLPGGIANPLGIVPSDYQVHPVRVEGPGAFWITNPNNTIDNNVVVGTDGVAYWYGLPEEPTGLSAGITDIQPRKIPILSFKGNVAHAVGSGIHFDHSHDQAQEQITTAPYTPELNGIPIWTELEDFTCYQMDRGLWSRTTVNTAGHNIHYKNLKLLDCTGKEMVISAWKGRMTNCLFVGNSPNFQPNPDYVGFTAALSLYDGGYELFDNHFQDFDLDFMSLFAWFGGAADRCNDFFTRCTFDNVNIYNDRDIHRPVRLNEMIRDIDGTLTNIPGAMILPEHPYVLDETNFVKINERHIGYQTTIATYPGKIEIKGQDLDDENSMYSEWSKGHGVHGSVWGASQQFLVFHKLDRDYLFRWLNQISGETTLAFRYVQDGDLFDCRFEGSNEELKLKGISPSTSKALLYSHQQTGYYWDPNEEMLYVRLRADNDVDPNDQVYEAFIQVVIETLSGNTINAKTSYPIEPSPYKGIRHNVNAIVQAEHFDYGGQYKGYLEMGGQAPDPIHSISKPGYRYWNGTRDSDILRHGEVTQLSYDDTALDEKGGLDHISAGEYWNYTYHIPASQYFKFQLKVRSSLSSAGFAISVDGDQVLDQSWTLDGDKYQHINSDPLFFTQGQHTITITATQDEMELDWIAIVDTFIGLIDDMAGDNDGDGKDYASEILIGRDPNSICDIGSEFDIDGDIEEWWGDINIDNTTVSDGRLSGIALTADPYIVSPSTTFKGDDLDYIQIRVRASANGTSKLFWINSNGGFGPERVDVVEYTGDGDWQILTFDPSNHPQWSGQSIYNLRIDPTNQLGWFEIDWIRGGCGNHTNTSLDSDGDGKVYSEEVTLGYDPDSPCDFSNEWNRDGYFENWYGFTNLSNVSIDNGVLKGQPSTNDPSFNSPNLSFAGQEVKAIKVRIKSQVNSAMELFWRNANGQYSGTHKAIANYTQSGEWQTVIFDLSQIPEWANNTIYGLRLDPTNTLSPFEIDWVRGSCIAHLSTTSDMDGDGKTYEEEIGLGRNPESVCDFGYSFDDDGDFEDWPSTTAITNISSSNGNYLAQTTTNDSNMRSHPLALDGNDIDVIEVRFKASTNGVTELFWSNQNGGFSGVRRLEQDYTGNGDYQTLRFEVHQESEWRNALIKQFRIDPSNQVTQFSIDWIRGYCCISPPCSNVPGYTDNDLDGFDSSIDCNDNNASINPGSLEIPNNSIDENCDGNIVIIDQDKDGYSSDEDCDDSDPIINSGQIEIYGNSIDENCDGIAEGPDEDKDGYPVEFDCDDTDPNINPGQAEIPANNIDENCDGFIQNPLIDLDQDGYDSTQDCDDQNPFVNLSQSEIPNNDTDENCDGILGIIDIDGDGYNSDEDCDDLNPNINPGATEIANNTIDENCDGTFAGTDNDEDNYESDEDCDDLNPDIYPGASEVCDGLDNNCDGRIDEGFSLVTYFMDQDGDGYGDQNTSITTCMVLQGYSTNSNDCDDLNPDINPQSSEACDGIDNNCDGNIDEGLAEYMLFLDQDGDGFGDSDKSILYCAESLIGYVENQEDCDDANSNINPESTEILNNGIDEDCDGEDLILSTTDLTPQKFTIYPNPAQSYIKIRSNHLEMFQYQIYQLDGKLVLNGLLHSSNSIDIQHLKSSIYLIKVIDQDENLYISRFLVNR